MSNNNLIRLAIMTIVFGIGWYAFGFVTALASLLLMLICTLVSVALRLGWF